MSEDSIQAVANDWVSFPGGELEGRRPKAVCPACRARVQRVVARRGVLGARIERQSTRALCFQCYRADLDRERALRVAGQLLTASEARFQDQLPFEPIHEGRLTSLTAERSDARGALLDGVGRFTDRRRRAQIAARHALHTIVASRPTSASECAAYDRTIAAALHAAELQLPESWMPFVVAR